MHYTASSFQSTDAFFTQNQANNGIIAHYVINDDGVTYKYVDEDLIAKHAGVSYWNGFDSINKYSVGIENVNLGFTPNDQGGGIPMDGQYYYQFPEEQIKSLAELTIGIIERYDIKPYNIVGHSDIAMPFGRKPDPGPLFPWEQLAKEYGIGLWYNLSKTHDDFVNFNAENAIGDLSDNEKQDLFVEQLMALGYGNPNYVSDPQQDNSYHISQTNDQNIINKNTHYLIQSYNMHYRPEKGISSSFDTSDFEIVYSLNYMKHEFEINNFTTEEIKVLYIT